MTEEKSKKQKIKKQRCKRCNSSFTYIRRKDESRVCRNCGNLEQLGDINKKFQEEKKVEDSKESVKELKESVKELKESVKDSKESVKDSKESVEELKEGEITQ